MPRNTNNNCEEDLNAERPSHRTGSSSISEAQIGTLWENAIRQRQESKRAFLSRFIMFKPIFEVIR
jgi:hypothetical protein